MFLGVEGKVSGWSSKEDQCEIFLSKNPLEEWVELPPNMAELRYSNIIGGAIRGALEMVRTRMKASCRSTCIKNGFSLAGTLQDIMRSKSRRAER
jgi:hypothetical protein